MNNFAAIPDELKAVPSWVCWRYEDIGSAKPTKVPYSPHDGSLASVNNPNSWSSFDTAVKACELKNYDGIGFVLSDNDPFFAIDLDDTKGDKEAYERQVKIFKEFDSYSEISPSGSGLHIIGKGKVPAGRRRSFIEIYSSQRYITFTGNVYHNIPIAYRQDMLSQLWEQMAQGGPATYLYKGDAKEVHSDEEIISKARLAVNGDKFELLNTGKWQELYPSQSEADLAYIDILAFYTQNKNQIIRIFRKSPLGARQKAQRIDYMNWMILKSFDKMLPQLDFDGFRNAIEEKIAKEPELKLAGGSPSGKATVFDTVIAGSNPAPPAIVTHKRSDITLPPGLLGEIAQFIYQAAPRPVPEIALAGAIGLMAGICGRAYNVSNTGLNQYVLLLAKTGMGKEGMAAGIDKLMNAIKVQVPTANEFVGPTHIASGQALVKYVHKKSQCFVSIIGEFGITLKNMSSQNASSHERMLKQILLELYNKSGYTDIYRPSINADLEKNTEATASPAFSMLCESVPSTFYETLDEDMIREGLLPRFMIIEYNGARVDLNKNHHLAMPPNWLIDKLVTMTSNAKQLMHNHKVINVAINDDALKVADDFDAFATKMINSTENEVVLNLWNRAHLKALKLAALIAVGVNMFNPIITLADLNWSIKMVEDDIHSMSTKFEAGQVGDKSSERKQEDEVIRMIKEFVTLDWEKVRKYTDKQILHLNKAIPYSYLSRRLMTNTAFKNDRMGSTYALKRTLQVLMESDKIREVGKVDATSRFGTSQRLFIISNTKILD